MWVEWPFPRAPRPPTSEALAKTRRSLLKSLAGLAAVGGGAWLVREHVLWPEPPVQFSGPDSGWLPFTTRFQSAVTVRAMLNGVRVNALVDSGAQYSVVDRAFAERLNLPASLAPPLLAYGAGGNPQVGRGAAVDVSVGALRLPALKAAVLNLGPISQEAGLSAPLILGQDVLHELVADIDFPGRRMRFLPQQGFVVPENAVETPSRRRGRALFVEVTVEGERFEVMLDTGASFALGLTDKAADAAGLLAGRKITPSRSVVLGGVAAGGVVTLDTIRFGEIELRKSPVHIFPGQPLPGFPDGLLGFGALAPYRALLDHGHGRLLLIG